MRRRIFCMNCGRSGNYVKRLYVREQISKPFNDQGLSDSEKAIFKRLRGGKSTCQRQQFVAVGTWCRMCGNVTIDRQSVLSKLKV